MNIESTVLDRTKAPLNITTPKSSIVGNENPFARMVATTPDNVIYEPQDNLNSDLNVDGNVFGDNLLKNNWQADLIKKYYSGHGELGRGTLKKLLPSQIAPALADVFSAHENFVQNTPPDLTTSIEIAVQNYAKQQLVTFLHEHAAHAEVTPVEGKIDDKGRFMIGNFDMVATAQKNLQLTPNDPRSQAELKGMLTLQDKLAHSDDVHIVLSPTKYAAENTDEEYGLGFVMSAQTMPDGTRKVNEQIIRYKERMGESAVSKGLYRDIADKAGVTVNVAQLQQTQADQMFAQVLSLPKAQFDAAFGNGELSALFGKTEVDEQTSMQFLQELKSRRGDMLQLYANLVHKNVNINTATPERQIAQFVGDSSLVVNKMFAYSKKLMHAIKTGDYHELNQLDAEIDRFMLTRQDKMSLGEVYAIGGALNVLLPNVYMQNGQCPSAYALGSAMGQYAGGASYVGAMGGMLFGSPENTKTEKVVATFKVNGKAVRAIECVKCPGCGVVGVHFKDGGGKWHCSNVKDIENFTSLSKAANAEMKKRKRAS